MNENPVRIVFLQYSDCTTTLHVDLMDGAVHGEVKMDVVPPTPVQTPQMPEKDTQP